MEEADHDLLEACAITDLDELARQCMAARQLLGKPTARWTARCLSVVIKLAVVTRGWPPASMEQALLAVAGTQKAARPQGWPKPDRGGTPRLTEPTKPWTPRNSPKWRHDWPRPTAGDPPSKPRPAPN